MKTGEASVTVFYPLSSSDVWKVLTDDGPKLVIISGCDFYRGPKVLDISEGSDFSQRSVKDNFSLKEYFLYYGKY